MEPIQIYFENSSLLICEKPAGISSEDDGLPDILCKQIGTSKLYTVHRLDSAVSGGIVYAKTREAAASLSSQIVSGDFSKKYIAVAEGLFDENEGLWDDLLFYDRKQGKSYVVKKEREGVKRALLRYKVMGNVLTKDGKEASLIEFELLTGRTHQIRVQLASRRHPVLGDRRYGSKEKISGIALRSYKLKFIDPETGTEMEFESPIPDEYPWNNIV